MTSDWAAQKRKVTVDGHQMACVERGQGDLLPNVSVVRLFATVGGLIQERVCAELKLVPREASERLRARARDAKANPRPWSTG